MGWEWKLGSVRVGTLVRPGLVWDLCGLETRERESGDTGKGPGPGDRPPGATYVVVGEGKSRKLGIQGRGGRGDPPVIKKTITFWVHLAAKWQLNGWDTLLANSC